MILKRRNKKYKKSQAMNILIYVIAAIIALFLILQFYPKIRRSMEHYTKDQCYQEIIGLANVNSPEEIKLTKCPIKKIIVDKTHLDNIYLDEFDKKFMNEQSKDELSTKINKIFANELIKCYRKTGSGRVSLYGKVETREFNRFKDKSICVFCDLIELSDEIKQALEERYGRNVELKDLKFIQYLNYRPSYKGNYYEELREKNPLLAYIYFAEENFNFKLDSKYYIIFTSYYATNNLQELVYTPAKSLFKFLTNYAIEKTIGNVANFWKKKNHKEMIGSYISFTTILPYYNDQEINNICSYIVNK